MSVRVTDCECTESGWCERHQCHKSEFWYRLCQRDPALFDRWEKGHGLGQGMSAGLTAPRRQQTPCAYRGDVLREEECPSCQQNVRIKIFRCELHRECTSSSRLSSVHSCGKCPDYISEPKLNHGSD